MSDKPRWLGWQAEFWWAVHNLFAHPISQALYMIGWIGGEWFQRMGDGLHDVTIPTHVRGSGHG